MESTVKLTWNAHFILEVKVKKTDKEKVIKALEGNQFHEIFSSHPCNGFYIMSVVVTIKRAYLLKQILKNIQVYD